MVAIDDPPPPPKPSRTRVYSVVLVVVTLCVVTLAVLLPVVLNRYAVAPPPTPSAGANVQVDSYATGSNWTGQFGDDPSVAVAPNGTIAIGWEGLDELSPPSTPGGIPTFDTAIFVSFSHDQGAHYTAPQVVGPPATVAAIEPALAFAPNGTLFVAYTNATNTENEQILVDSAAPGRSFGPGVVAVAGQDLGEERLFVLPSGTLVLAFTYLALVEWTASTNGGRTFTVPTILLEGFLTGGTVWENDRITLVGLSVGALTFTTVSVWSVTFNATGAGPAQMGTAATMSIPYPVSEESANMSRPGPSVTASGSLLYLVYSSDNESELVLQTSSTNGSSWAGPWTLWSGQNLSIETPAVETGPGGNFLGVGWESTQGGHWQTYAAVFSIRSGLLSSPAAVSSAAGFPADVRNWHGWAMGLAILDSAHFVVAWGDGRGLAGTFGLTHIYASTVVAQLS